MDYAGLVTGTIALLIVLTEGIWEFFSGVIPQTWKDRAKAKSFPLDRMGTLLVALVLCFGAIDVNILAELGLPFKWSVVAIIITAIFVARLSNPVHDFLKFIESKKVSQRLNNDYLNNNIDAGM